MTAIIIIFNLYPFGLRAFTRDYRRTGVYMAIKSIISIPKCHWYWRSQISFSLHWCPLKYFACHCIRNLRDSPPLLLASIRLFSGSCHCFTTKEINLSIFFLSALIICVHKYVHKRWHFLKKKKKRTQASVYIFFAVSPKKMPSLMYIYLLILFQLLFCHAFYADAQFSQRLYP